MEHPARTAGAPLVQTLTITRVTPSRFFGLNLMYISKMPRKQKTPQQKKELELKKDHFTFSEAPHAFRKNWKRKKAHLNRLYRRKSGEALSAAKVEMSGADAEVLIGDVTAKHLKESVLTKRLNKWSAVSLGEKIEIKSQKRLNTVDRRAKGKRNWDQVVTSVVTTLLALEGDELIQVVKRIAGFIQGGGPVEWMRAYKSKDHLIRAIFFVEQINRGNAHYVDALRRNQELCIAFRAWIDKANRILAKQRRPAQRKAEQKIATERKIKTLTRQSRLK